jgi:hypothetical protein
MAATASTTGGNSFGIFRAMVSASATGYYYVTLSKGSTTGQTTILNQGSYLRWRKVN